MLNKIITSLLSIILLLFAGYILAAIQNLYPTKYNADFIPVEFLTLDKNTIIFTNNNKNYQIINQAYAIKNNNNIKRSNTANVWSKQVGNYQIKIPTTQTLSTQNTQSYHNNTTNYAVVYNNNSQKFGIITGNIVVKFSGNFLPQYIVNTYGVKIESEFAHLNIAFFSVPNGVDILTIKQQLSQDVRVESVNLDILETINIPL